MRARKPVSDLVRLSGPSAIPPPHLWTNRDVESPFMRVSQADPIRLIFKVPVISGAPCTQRELRTNHEARSRGARAHLSQRRLGSRRRNPLPHLVLESTTRVLVSVVGEFMAE